MAHALTFSPPRGALPSCSSQTAGVTAANTSCLISSPLCLPFPPPGWGFLLGFATQNSTLLTAQLGAPGGASRRPGEAGSALQMTLGPPGRLSHRQGGGRTVGGALGTPATPTVPQDSSGWDDLASSYNWHPHPGPRTAGAQGETSPGLKGTSLESTA